MDDDPVLDSLTMAPSLKSRLFGEGFLQPFASSEEVEEVDPFTLAEIIRTEELDDALRLEWDLPPRDPSSKLSARVKVRTETERAVPLKVSTLSEVASFAIKPTDDGITIRVLEAKGQPTLDKASDDPWVAPCLSSRELAMPVSFEVGHDVLMDISPYDRNNGRDVNLTPVDCTYIIPTKLVDGGKMPSDPGGATRLFLSQLMAVANSLDKTASPAGYPLGDRSFLYIEKGGGWYWMHIALPNPLGDFTSIIDVCLPTCNMTPHGIKIAEDRVDPHLWEYESILRDRIEVLQGGPNLRTLMLGAKAIVSALPISFGSENVVWYIIGPGSSDVALFWIGDPFVVSYSEYGDPEEKFLWGVCGGKDGGVPPDIYSSPVA